MKTLVLLLSFCTLCILLPLAGISDTPPVIQLHTPNMPQPLSCIFPSRMCWNRTMLETLEDDPFGASYLGAFIFRQSTPPAGSDWMILCDGRQRFCPAPPDLRLEFNVDLPNPVGVPSFVEYSVCDVGACSPFLGLPGQYPTISTRAIYNPVTLGPTGALVPEPAIAFTTPESNHTVLRLFVLYGVMVRAAPPDSYSVHVYLENFTTGNLDIKKADPLPDYWQFSYKSGCSCLVDRVKTPEYFDSQGNLAYNVTLYRNGVFVDDFVGTIDPWNEGGGTIDPPPIGP